MVTFPDELHPKHGLRLRFLYSIRAFQYLYYFNIIASSPEVKFFPLDLSFESVNELYQFLYNRGIVYDEFELEETYSEIEKKVTVVNTRKIFEVEEALLKYLLNYKYYSINEVADMLSFTRPTIYKFVNEQTLKATRINGQLRVNHLDLVEFINKENQK